MKTLPAILLAAVIAANTAWAAPYKSFDSDSLISKNGEKYNINIGVYIQAVENLALHAADYPTRFDNDSDRKQAITDTQILGVMADMLTENGFTSENLPLLHLNARLYWIGHNLEQEGFAEKADASYAALLEQGKAADKAALQEEYGRFLASTGNGKRAEAELRAAHRAGRKESALALGMVLIAERKTEEGSALLRQYVKDFPQDKQAADLLQAVETGNIEFKTETPESKK